MKFIFVFCFTFFLTGALFCQYEFLSPLPGSQFHPRQTNIILRYGDSIDPISLQQAGIAKISGYFGINYGFHVFLSEDEKTIIFDPVNDFNVGELINVSISNKIKNIYGESKDSIAFSFRVSDNPVDSKSADEELIFGEKMTLDSVPATFPKLNVLVNDNPAPGYIFFHNTSGLASAHDRFIAIIDSATKPVFYIQDNVRGLAFTKQKTGHLSYFNGYENNFYLLDSACKLIDSFACGNGYTADFHEFIYLENGHSFLLSHDQQLVNLSLWDTTWVTDANVIGLVVQELDKDKNVIFQWRSWDYFQFTDALHYFDPTQHNVSYVHGNSLDIDLDSNLLLSCYQMDEITKINRKTGEIIWRMGGKNNQFMFINDSARFNCQHDVRRLPNGNITMFDNGNFHVPNYTDAREYQVDEVNKTVELVWSFVHPNHFNCPRSGNVQRLPNGNTFINWGWKSSNLYPSFTEVKPDGTIVYDAYMESSQHLIYRAYKFDWTVINQAVFMQEPLKINIYPNPATNVLVISGITQNDYINSILISDINGNIQKITRFPDFADNSLNVNISEINKGFFIVKIITVNNCYTACFLKL